MCYYLTNFYNNYLLLLNLYFNYVLSEITCPKNYNQWGMSSFHLERFQGIWFERWQTFEDRNCSFLDFTNCDNSGDGFCDLLDHTVIPGDEKDDIYEGTVRYTKNKKGHILFDFKDKGNFDMFIVDTDYDNCAVGYVCGQTGEYILALSRDRVNTDGCLKSLKKFLAKRGISYEDITKEGGRFKSEPKLQTAELYRVNQLNCPLINTGGIARCPNNFEQLAINQLDLHLFQGHWFELWSTQMDRLKASHDFRDCDNNLGTCEVIFTDYSHETNRAIVDYGVSIRKPLNRGLININITRENSLLSVQYSILYTDYTTCSVVYSCGIELNGDSSGQFIYILSKQRSRNHELCTNKAQQVLENNGFYWTQLQSLNNRKGINFYVTGILNKTIQ